MLLKKNFKKYNFFLKKKNKNNSHFIFIIKHIIIAGKGGHGRSEFIDRWLLDALVYIVCIRYFIHIQQLSEGKF